MMGSEAVKKIEELEERVALLERTLKAVAFGAMTSCDDDGRLRPQPDLWDLRGKPLDSASA